MAPANKRHTCGFVYPNGKVCPKSFYAPCDRNRHRITHTPEQWTTCQYCLIARRAWEAAQPEGNYIAGYTGTRTTTRKWSKIAPDRGPNVFATAQNSNLKDHISRMHMKVPLAPRKETHVMTSLSATEKGSRSTTGTSSATIKNSDLKFTAPSQQTPCTAVQPHSPFQPLNDDQFSPDHLNYPSSNNPSPFIFTRDLTPGLSDAFLNLKPFLSPYGHNVPLDQQPDAGPSNGWTCPRCLGESICICGDPVVTGGQPIYDAFPSNQGIQNANMLWTGGCLDDVPDMGFSGRPSPAYTEQLLTPISIQGEVWKPNNSSPHVAVLDYNVLPGTTYSELKHQQYPTTRSQETLKLPQYEHMHTTPGSTGNALGLSTASSSAGGVIQGLTDLLPNSSVGGVQSANINESGTEDIFHLHTGPSHTSADLDIMSDEDFRAFCTSLGDIPY